MNAETALYNTISDAVDAATSGQSLYGASVFSSTRGNAASADKTIRIQVLSGMYQPATDPALNEHRCEFVIQCLCKAGSVGLAGEQAAQEAADDLALAVLDVLVGDPSLGGEICTLDMFDGEKNFDRLVIDLGAAKYGSFYWYGVINPIG